MKSLNSIILIAVIIGCAPGLAAGDDFQLGVQQANSKIQKYEQARASGNPAVLRQATMELQADPLAIRLVNRSSSDAFKTQLNQDIGAVQSETRDMVKERMANQMGVSADRISVENKSGVTADRVTFFEATNPPKPGDPIKVGQDWDMTVRVDGRDVPTKISQPLVHEAYFEAGTGKKPPSIEAANHYAEQQSLAVTDYQFKEAYGGGPKEGGAIIAGPKDARLRDPTQLTEVIDFKSTEARNIAADLRAEGKPGDAVGRDIEELRQSTKQFDKQVVPRVEAMGGQVPDFIQKGQDIMKKVDTGELTPAQAAEQLKGMGETPETFIKKTAELVEAVQVLQAPSKRGEPAPDVFVENVGNRLAGKGIDPEAVAKPEGNASGREPLTEGVSSFAPESGPVATARSTAGNALGAIWQAASAGEAAAQEGRRALGAGQAPDRFGAAVNAMAEATLIPAIGRSFDHGQQIGKEELAKAEKEGRSTGDAYLSGAGRVAKDVTAWNLGSKIAQEEIEAEQQQAAREGREPSYTSSTLNGMVRGLGEVLMINTIARSGNSVTQEEVILQGQQDVIRARAQGKMNEKLKELNGIKTDLQELMATGDPRDPGFSDRYKELKDRYDRTRIAAADIVDATQTQFGENDPLVKTLRERTGGLPDPPTEEDVTSAAENEAGNQPGELADVPDSTIELPPVELVDIPIALPDPGLDATSDAIIDSPESVLGPLPEPDPNAKWPICPKCGLRHDPNE